MSINERIAAGGFKRIIVVTGAGVSTSAGIPDYRSETGLFAELMYEFPQARSPEDLFSRWFISKYKIIARIQIVKDASPTSTHMLCKWLYDKGWLVRVYTQNIDGLPEEMVVEYHGSLLKNNVVLYGDDIPQAALSQTCIDFINNTEPIDLKAVAPFCAIPNLVSKSCTRVLVDIHPENAFTNGWTKVKRIPECLYDLSVGMVSSLNVKFGKRAVSLRPQWGRHSKWKSQYIITQDCDTWSKDVMGS